MTTSVDQVLALLGAGGFGALLGWYIYYINRYRKGDVQLSDLTTLVGVIGGGSVTALFSTGGGLFGAYGIGLFLGFFGYFISLVYLVGRSRNFDTDWFLDGRRIRPAEPWYIPGDVGPTIHPMAPVQIHAAGPIRVQGAAPQVAGEAAAPAAPPTALFLVPATAPAAAATGDPTQPIVDSCAKVPFSGSADIATFFKKQNGFIGWYNKLLAGDPAFVKRGKIRTDAKVAAHFDRFWDQIPVIFGETPISAIEFCALMSIAIEENSGDLWANPELMGVPGHPGLAYAFDRIPGAKASYNHVNGNWSAFRLFQDADYLAAHGNLPGAAAVLNNGVNQQWDGETWPSGVSTKEDASVNGFVMEADFYKFRGRGVIQTTGRDDYKLIIDFVLSNPAAAANPTLAGLAQLWRAAAAGLPMDALLDTIATKSTNAQWDLCFGEPLILAAGVSIDSEAKNNYLTLSHKATTLNGGTSTRGSLYYMARKINAGDYPDRVVPKMKKMIAAVATESGS